MPTSSRPPSHADALVVHDVELGDPEGAGDLVLHDLDPGAGADRIGPGLEGLDAADVHAHAGVELQRAATGRRLGVAEHDADLLAQLVREDERGLAAVDRAGQLAQGLAHQAGLQADEGVAHVAFDLGAWHERGHRVDDHDVDAAGADERLGDLERLLAGVGLADEQLIDVDADVLGVAGIERVLGVDEGHDAAQRCALAATW